MNTPKTIPGPVVDTLPGMGAYENVKVGEGTYRPVSLQMGYGSCYLSEYLFEKDKGLKILMMRAEAIEVAERILTFYRVPFCNRVSNESL